MFTTHYLNEPKLLFNKNGESFNPCVGLIKYGPRFAGDKDISHRKFKIGIIGSAGSISQTRYLFESFEFKIPPKNEIKPWKIPFPGLNENTPLKFSFIFDPSWEKRINNNDIQQIKEKWTNKERAECAIDIIKEKMETIYGKESPPDLILISIPKEIFELCTDNKLIKPQIKIGDDDFHNRIKLLAMKVGIPTQLIRPETLIFKKTQEKCLIAWNLVVGILYKCQRGHPWKLTYLEDNTCYVGISFFKEKGKITRRASMAQIFLDTGESFVLRGDSFNWTDRKHPNAPHLSKENAVKIMESVLKQYRINKDGQSPSRIVIHKSSNFWDEELEGFTESTENIPIRDFITLLKSDIRFFRDGTYPILRGTLIETKNNSENFLYTSGFVPNLETYPGYSIPTPLNIKPFKMDSDIITVSKEIISFTKLDWNSTSVYKKYPVTIQVARRVGDVMSESLAQKMEDLDPHYYYYM